MKKPRFLKGLKKKRTKKPGIKKTSESPSVQSWLPVKDVAGGLLIRIDDIPVAVIRVDPAPFSLLSAAERSRRITALFEAIQALNGAAQICVVPRALDLDSYLHDLEQLQTTATTSQSTLLRGYTNYVRNLITSATAVEHRFYVLLPAERPNENETVTKKAREFCQTLKRAQLRANMCADEEILDLLFSYFHPVQAAFERVGVPAIAPVFMGVSK